jgi:hypothetical protein
MEIKFHRGALLLGAVMGIIAGLGMLYFIVETGANELIFPAFILWLIVPALLSKALRRTEEE